MWTNEQMAIVERIGFCGGTYRYAPQRKGVKIYITQVAQWHCCDRTGGPLQCIGFRQFTGTHWKLDCTTEKKADLNTDPMSLSTGLFLWWPQAGVQCGCTQWCSHGRLPLQKGQQRVQDLEQVKKNNSEKNEAEYKGVAVNFQVKCQLN